MISAGLAMAGLVAVLVLVGVGVTGALLPRAALAAAVGALLAGALAASLGILAAVAVVLLGLAVLVVFDAAWAAPVRSLQLARGGETLLRQNEPGELTLDVRNPGGRPARLRVRDQWPPSAGAAPAEQDVTVPPGERRRVVLTLRPTRRGVRASAGVVVRSRGPLGLAARQGGHRLPGSVQVLPAFPSRRYLPERLARLRQLDGAVIAPVRGQGTEFDSLREYVVGDDPRSIDWRATARSGSVAVRTWRPERDRRVVLVLDTGRTAAARVAGAPRLDTTLDAALLLGALAGRAGDRVDLLAVDRAVRGTVQGAAGTQVLGRLSAAAVALEPALAELDPTLLVSRVLARARRRCLVVLFTAVEPTAVEEGLLPVLPALTRRHLVVIASVEEPALDALRAGRADSDEVYAAAAATAAAAERAAVVERLRRAGAIVVQATPDRFAPAVADAYLELKAAGRL